MATRPTHICNKETDIALIHQEIKTIKESQLRMEHAVLGNGKPGLKDEMTELKGGLSAFKWVYGALIGLIGVVIAFMKL